MAEPSNTDTELELSDATVEVVRDEDQELLPRSAVTLEGDAALGLVDALGTTAKEAFTAGRKLKSTNLYRIVPREELARGLADKRLRMAIARKGGDASVLVKSAETGRIAGRADLKNAKPSAMKALGPVAWQAMALATQQHYLVEINDKLAGVQGAVDELLARLTDDKRAEADELRDEAARIRVKLARAENVDVSSLDNWLHRAGVLQKSLAATAERAANGYLIGEMTAREAEDAFALALFSAQSLAELSGLLVALPTSSTEQLQHRLDDEWARLGPRRERLRGIAATLNRGHHHWRMHQALYDERRPQNPIALGVNRISPLKVGEKAPRAEPLSAEGLQRAESLLGLAATSPESLLVEVGDGRVRVAVEREQAVALGSRELSDNDIDLRVTQYADGHWYADGHYGPYESKSAAVTRLRNL